MNGATISGPVASDLALLIPELILVVMALALLGTVVDGGIVLQNEACVAKSWPGYFDWLGRVANVAPE